MKHLGVRFDGAKRDDLQSSYRFAIPASPSRVFAAAIRRLIKRIAWRMQANHEGGLTERARNLSRCRRILFFPCPEPSL